MDAPCHVLRLQGVRLQGFHARSRQGPEHGDKVVFDANVLQMLRDTIDERELAAAGKDDDTKATVR